MRFSVLAAGGHGGGFGRFLDRGLGLDSGAQLPDEGAELAGDGDLDLVVVQPALGQRHEAGAEPQLGAP